MDKYDLPEIDKRPLSKKTLFAVILIAVVTLLICGVFFSFIMMLEPEPVPEPDDYYYYKKHSLEAFETDAGLAFVFDGKNVVTAKEGSSVAARDAFDTCVLFYGKPGDLYFADKNGYSKISENVVSCVLSLYGSRAVFFRRKGSGYELCSFDTADDLISVIEKSEYFADTDTPTVSPDGTRVVYRKSSANGDSAGTYISKNGGKGVHLEGVFYAETVSDDGKVILWRDESGRYHIRHDPDGTSDGTPDDMAEDTEIETDIPSTIISNRFCTQFIYSVSAGGTYLYSGGSVSKISDESVFGMCYPSNVIKGSGRIAMVNSFEMKLFLSGRNLSSVRRICYIGRKRTDTSYSVSVGRDSYVSYNLSVLYLTDEDGRLFKFNRNRPNDSAVISEKVFPGSLRMSYDGKSVYFRDGDGCVTLLYGGELYKLSAEAEEYEVAADGILYYTNSEGLFYSVKTGTVFGTEEHLSSALILPAAKSSDGIALLSSGGTVFALSHGKLYLLDGKRAPTLVAKNIIKPVNIPGA